MAREDVATTAFAIIGERQAHGLAVELSPDVANDVAAHHSHLDNGEVTKIIFERVESQKNDGEIDQCVFGAKGDEPHIELLQPLAEKAGVVGRDRRRGHIRREKNLEKVGHRKGCGHSEYHREQHEKAIRRKAYGVWLHVL